MLVGTAGGAENPAIDGRWQIDEYTATGGRQSWQPRFSYKGFQYVEVTGGQIDLVELAAIPVGSDVADTMELRLEHPELQWIADAFRRTAWNGLFGYPNINPFSMVGWLGAARNAVQPMSYQFGLARLFEHWLEDIRLAQAPSGAIPVVAPFGGPAAASSCSRRSTSASTRTWCTCTGRRMATGRYPSGTTTRSGGAWSGCCPSCRTTWSPRRRSATGTRRASRSASTRADRRAAGWSGRRS